MSSFVKNTATTYCSVTYKTRLDSSLIIINNAIFTVQAYCECKRRPMTDKNYKLGTKEASEQLIKELYVDLRRQVNKWASLTHQTAQARMGYVGQHLVSVVTGYPGGKSGARGKDLILPNGEFGEIKTCYRVDQLGRCLDCKTSVASIENTCPVCGSDNIRRNDDSKWLISIRHDEEFAHILDPRFYFFVLFEFVNLSQPDTIQMTIHRVESTVPGFAYCMIDYYLNIRANSQSQAPFNLWPHSLKFDLMAPELIYRAYVTKDDTITTQVWPDTAILEPLRPLTEYSRSLNLTLENIFQFSEYIGAEVEVVMNKRMMLEKLQKYIEINQLDPRLVINQLAKALYFPRIREYIPNLPAHLVGKLPVLNE